MTTLLTFAVGMTVGALLATGVAGRLVDATWRALDHLDAAVDHLRAGRSARRHPANPRPHMAPPCHVRRLDQENAS